MDKTITIQSQLGPEQHIIIYAKPLLPGDIDCMVTNAAADLNEDGEKFKEFIFIPNWQEIILAAKDDRADPRSLQLKTMTSFHLQAIRKGYPADIAAVSILGVTITADNKIVVGVRRGRMAGGQIHVSPAGYAGMRHADNPIFGTLLEEMLEELGVVSSNVASMQLIASESETNNKGIAFIVLAQLRLTSQQLDALHKQAVQPYEEALGQGVEELEARKKIASAGFSNVDAWEYSRLVFLQHEDLLQCITQHGVMIDSQLVPFVDACTGALIAYENVYGHR
jgi:hypothetical protein